MNPLPKLRALPHRCARRPHVAVTLSRAANRRCGAAEPIQPGVYKRSGCIATLTPARLLRSTTTSVTRSRHMAVRPPD
jgi:hypothetical protein